MRILRQLLLVCLAKTEQQGIFLNLMERRFPSPLTIAMMILVFGAAIRAGLLHQSNMDSLRARVSFGEQHSSDASVATHASSRAAGKGTYSNYHTNVIGKGEPVLLFFKAAWDPADRTLESDIEKYYARNSYDISTYRIDFDTAFSLREKFSVDYQHTVVLVDGAGNIVRSITSPSSAELQSLLGYKK